MKRLGKPRAIEPDAIDSPSIRRRNAVAVEAGYTTPGGIAFVRSPHGLMERVAEPLWHPDPAMRARGFTRNPARCGHNHKTLLASTFQWRCADCGEVTQ